MNALDVLLSLTTDSILVAFLIGETECYLGYVRQGKNAFLMRLRR